MLRGCLFSLALYAALAAAYFVRFKTILSPPESYVAAGVIGFLVLCCVGALYNAHTAWKTARLIASGRDGRWPRDGQLIAAAGRIYPTGQPLLAPFSGAECVVCEYDLTSPDRVAAAQDPQRTGSDFAGFLMAPCAIRSHVGEVRLLGFPILEGFDDAICAAGEAVRNARQFLASTTFEDRSGLKVAGVLSVFGEIWSDDDGRVQKHLRLSKADPLALFPTGLHAELARQEATRAAHATRWEAEPDVDECEVGSRGEDGLDDEGLFATLPKMTEKRVEVGEEVCAIGIYREMQRGLGPAARGQPPTRLVRGSAEQLVQRSRTSLWLHLSGGLAALVFIHAAAAGLIYLTRHAS